MKLEWSLRTVYLYLVSFVTLIMIIFGSVQLIQSVVALVYPPPVYSPGPIDIQGRVKLEVPSGMDEGDKVKVAEEQSKLERERQEQQIRYDRAREMARGLALLVVAMPIYLVIRRTGSVAPEFFIAARTLSLASYTAVSGSPTIVKIGSPLETSTSTGWASKPTTPTLLICANITFPTIPLYCGNVLKKAGSIYIYFYGEDYISFIAPKHSIADRFQQVKNSSR